MQILIGLAALALLVWLANNYVKANPALLSRYGKKAVGGVALIVGVALLLKGRADIGIPLAVLGVWLLGLNLPIWPWYVPMGNGANTVGRTDKIETEHTLDGRISGRFLDGRYRDQKLDALDFDALVNRLIEFQRIDAKSARLLHVYLDSRFPGWREAAQGNAHARQGRATGSATITKEEAYEILGLQMGASEEEIRKAHRALMKKLHPDQGGSTYLATRVNMAKDVLLRSHHA